MTLSVIPLPGTGTGYSSPNHNFYDTISHDNFPLPQLFKEENGFIPSYYDNEKIRYFITQILEDFKDKLIFKSYGVYSGDELFRYVFKLEPTIWITLSNYKSRGKGYTLELYCSEQHDFKTIIDGFIKYILPKSKKKKQSKINIISQAGSRLDLMEFKFKAPKIDIGLNYGEEFLDKHQVIIERLNKKDDKGIILLHSIPGTGKTTYLKYLLSVLKKKIIYVPPHMTNILLDPSFISFIAEHDNSVLVIEDAENILRSREKMDGSPSAMSNILNLSDGIMSDCLKIQIICTFNTSLTDIDAALLRKGRLIMSHEFKKLEVVNAQKVADNLKLDFKVLEPMTLGDIYNYTDFNHNASKPAVKKIGF